MTVKKTAVASRGFFLFLLLAPLLSGCELAPLQNQKLSSLDSQYRLQRSETDPEVKAENTSSAIALYRGIVTKSLASHCKWYPSDSVYTDLAQKRCGLAQGTLRGVARFMVEEDAGRMGYPTVTSDQSLRFVDIPDDCAL